LSDLEARESSDHAPLAKTGVNAQDVLVGKGSSGKKVTHPMGYERKPPGKTSKR